jgi:hypothetical protein
LRIRFWQKPCRPLACVPAGIAMPGYPMRPLRGCFFSRVKFIVAGHDFRNLISEIELRRFFDSRTLQSEI